MISPKFNFEQFANAVMGKDVYDIIYLAEKEATEAWRRTYRKQSYIGEEEANSRYYQEKLIGLIDYLRHGVKPRAYQKHNGNENDVQLFKSIHQSVQSSQRQRLASSLFTEHTIQDSP